MNARATFADRGRQALTGPVSFDDIEALLREGGEVLAQAKQAAAACRSRSLDPAVTSQAAKRESTRAADLELECERTQRLLDALKKRAGALQQAEVEAKLRAEYDAAREERDVLTADLEAKWPRLSAEMVELLRRIAASDARLAAVNGSLPAGGERLVSAEALARGLPANFLLPTSPAQPATRLRSAVIPRFAPGSAVDALLWAPAMAGASWRAL